MNLQYGKPLKTGLDLASTDFVKLLSELLGRKFSGYVCVCVKGGQGIEEGTLFLDATAGRIVGATYTYMKHGVTVNGKPAFERIMNATAAKQGVIDAYELDAEQVHLALAVNDDLIFVPDLQQLRGIKVEKFSVFYEQEILKQAPAPKQNAENLFKKFGISGLAGGQEKPKNANVMGDLARDAV